MPEQPVIVVEHESDAVIVHVQPENLDETNIQEVRSGVMAEAAAAPGSFIVLDLAGVRFIPSLSLAALIRMLTECRARDQRLMLVGLHPNVRELFRVTRLDRLFELQADVPAALKKIRPM